MKLLSRSSACHQDAADLELLVATLSAEQINETRRLVELVEARGFSRGRDLRGALEEVTDRVGGRPPFAGSPAHVRWVFDPASAPKFWTDERLM